MALNITEQQYRTVMQSIQSRYIWLELLNYNFQTVDELSGVAVGGSITIDANADVRRTGSIELVVKDSTFEVQSGGKIWLDKYVRVWVGIASLHTGEIERTNCGLYIIDAPSYSYNTSTNTLTLNLLDLMSKLTGIRSGYLKGIPTVIKAGESIRKAIIDTLALGGFTQYVIDEPPSPGTVPNDLEFAQGSTVYDILSGLRDIYPNYEMYFNTEGVFYYKPIPTGYNEPISVDDSLFNHIVLSEDLNTDFQNVKNSIEVYGRTHEPAHYSTATSVSGKEISLTIADVSAYTADLIYGFTLTDNTGITSPTLKINSLASYPIKNDDGTSTTIQAESGEVYYCVQFKTDHWRWLGHLQAYGFAEDLNEQSPFFVGGTVGRIRLPLYDGDYANCVTDNLAQQRAEYELWKHTNLNNTLTLNVVPVYWLDVNILVEYTLKRNNIKGQYLIKNINLGLAPTDASTIQMIQYYPDTPSIISD